MNIHIYALSMPDQHENKNEVKMYENECYSSDKEFRLRLEKDKIMYHKTPGFASHMSLNEFQLYFVKKKNENEVK